MLTISYQRHKNDEDTSGHLLNVRHTIVRVDVTHLIAVITRSLACILGNMDASIFTLDITAKCAKTLLVRFASNINGGTMNWLYAYTLSQMTCEISITG